MTKYVYLLADHGEYGPEDPIAVLRAEDIPAALEARFSATAIVPGREDDVMAWRVAQRESLREAMALEEFWTVTGIYKLDFGWGAPAVYVVPVFEPEPTEDERKELLRAEHGMPA